MYLLFPVDARLVFVCLSLVCFDPLGGACLAAEESTSQRIDSVTDQLSKIHASNARDWQESVELGGELVVLVRRVGAEKVTDKNITRIILLLDSDNDSIRAAAANCLARIGPRGSAAIPKLIKLISDAPCGGSDLSSQLQLTLALKSMNVSQPKSNCKGGQWEQK